MTIDWKQKLITTPIRVAAVYAIEFGISVITAEPFQKPSIATLIAIIVAVNVGNIIRDESWDSRN